MTTPASAPAPCQTARELAAFVSPALSRIGDDVTTALTVAAVVALFGAIVSFTLRISRGIDRRRRGEAPEPTRGSYVVVVVVFAFFAAASIFKLTGH